MSEPREPLHQPPNPGDLRRAPPATPACARVRGLLRDHADGDLEAADRAAVDEHVHACRRCAIELSRAEHEVLRLRQAFAAAAAPPAVPPRGFADRVVDRLVRDETLLLSRDGLAALQRAAAAAPPAGGPAAGAPIAGAPLATPSSRRLLAALLASAALVVALAFGGAGWLGGLAEFGPQRSARLVVTAGGDIYGGHGEAGGSPRWSRLGTGGFVGDNGVLLVAGAEAAEADYLDASSDKQPAARLRAEPSVELALRNGVPVLAQGELQIAAQRPIAVALADGSRVELGIGEYLLRAERLGGFGDLFAGAPADLRVSLEVLRGDAARLLRRESGAALVSEGELGVYAGGGAVQLRAAARPGGGGATGAGAARSPGETSPEAEAPAPPRLQGSVREARGGPLTQAEVWLAVPSRGPQFHRCVTDGAGVFTLAGEGVADSPFAVLSLRPSAPGLSLLVPDAYPLTRQGDVASLGGPLVVPAVPALYGTVVQSNQGPRAGVRLVPCIVDELFGLVRPWSEGQEVTRADGSFLLHGLPAQLPPHLRVVLVALHPQLAPRAVPLPHWGAQEDLPALPEVVMAPRRQVRLVGLEPLAAYDLLEELPGLPVGSAAAVQVVRSNGQGIVPIAEVGHGGLWLRQPGPNGPLVRALQLEGGGGSGALLRYRPRPAATARPEFLQFRDLEWSPGFGVRFAFGFRHEFTALPPRSGGRWVRVVDAQVGRVVPGTQLFAVAAAGGPAAVLPRFVGFTGGDGALAVELRAGETHLVAVGPAGGFGHAALAELTGPIGSMWLQPPGRVLVDESLRPAPGAPVQALLLRFERTDDLLPGLAPVVYRYAAAANGWEVGGLPAGEYRVVVDGRTLPVEVPSGGFTELR